ncbi:MAG: JAB domain-containing protein, partial [Polyangiaceae bacterium]
MFRGSDSGPHCHPSGDPTPSAEDLTTTAKIMRACDVLGIPVLDHVIVTRDPSRYHSMVDRG